jgi:peptide/nickel transport system permease protein
MIRFILKRLLHAVPILLGVSVLLFFVLHLAPGDPSYYYFSTDSSPETQARMAENLGLDQPLGVQFLRWISAFARFDFQYSLIHHRPVTDLILEALPRTLVLSSAALLLMFGGGILLGVFSAARRNSFADHAVSVVSLFFYSMPTFWLALMLVLLFALLLPIMPPSGLSSPNADLLPPFQRLLDRLWHLALPALTLGLSGAAGIARYARGSLLEVAGQDYIRTARAKGLSERQVLFKHSLRNGLIPVITLFGLSLPFLFGGSVLVEWIFAWHGMGWLMVSAIGQRDYPLVIGCTFFYSLMVVLGNLVADLLYRAADPRIRRES